MYSQGYKQHNLTALVGLPNRIKSINMDVVQPALIMTSRGSQ